jgi:hypothetical protein
VIRAAACVSVAVRSPRAIDRNGLHVSNLAALADCMRAVAQEDATRLVDGFRIPACELEHTAVVDGDARSAAVAAASVIAKVTRDRYMRRVASIYPDWNFEGNVGYSTPEHRDAILAHGICPLHRRSFASVAYSQLGLDSDEYLGGREEASEGSADVIDIREAIRAEADPDDVEAIARDAGRSAPVRDPLAGEPAQLELLPAAHREGRSLGTEARPLPPGLHLDEDQGRAVQRNEVELARRQAHVPPDDPPAGALEPRGDQVLALPSQCLPRKGHVHTQCGEPPPAPLDPNKPVTRL